MYCTGTTKSANLSLRSGKVPDALGDACVFVADDAGSTVHPRKCFCYGSGGGDQGLATWYDARANRVCLTGVMGATVSYTSSLLPGTSSGGYISAIDTALSSLQFMTMVGTLNVPTSVTTRTSTSTIYSAGYTRGVVPLSPNAFQSSLNGSLDGFMIAIDSEGVNLRYGSYIGGSGNDYSAAKVLIVERGCLFRIVFGITTHSVNFPTTANTYQPLKLNGSDDQPAIVMFSSKPNGTLSVSSIPCKTTAHLQATSSCPLSSIRWDLGDGAIVNDSVNFDHNYPKLGNYTVNVRMITTEGDTIYLTQDVLIGNTHPVDAGDDQVVCKGNSAAQLHASGAMLFRWRPGKGVSDTTISNPFVHPDTTTTYVVYGMDAFGCESKDSVTILVQSLKIAAQKDTAICPGQVAFLQASGADFYSWTPTTGLSQGNAAVVRASPSTTTKYRVIGIQGSCYDTAYVNVTVFPKPRIHLPAIPGVCPQTQVVLGFVADAPIADSDIVSVRWSPASAMSDATSRTPVVSPTKSSWYAVTVRTKDGCEVSDSVFVAISTKLTIGVSADTSVCVGKSVQLHGFGATNFEWSPPDYLSDPLSSSPLCTAPHSITYRVIGHGGQCVDTQFVHVNIVPLPSQLKAYGDTTVCANDRVHLWAESDSSTNQYHWYPEAEFENAHGASVYLKPTKSQTYYVLVSNKGGCTTMDSVKVHVDSTIALSVGNNASGCVGESVDLLVTNALDSSMQVLWTPNDGVWDPVTQRYHVVISQDRQYHIHVQRGSCFNDATLSVHAKPNPVFSVSYDSTVCVGGSVQLNASSSQAGMKYRWLRNGVPDTSLSDPLRGNPQTHALYADWDGVVEASLDSCVALKTAHITVLFPPVVQMSADTTICIGDSASIALSATDVGSVAWSPTEGLHSTSSATVVASPSHSTTYTARVAGTNGCVRTDSVRVLVQQHVPLWLKVEDPWPRSIFVPGDSMTLKISAWTDSSRVFNQLSFDLVCVDDILQPAHVNFQDIGGYRSMHFDMQQVQLNAGSTTVQTIRAMALQTTRPTSALEITNVSTDASLCPVIQTAPSELSIQSCFVKGRNVSYTNPVHAQIFPQPTTSTLGLHVDASYRGILDLSVMNVLGQVVKSFHVQHDAEHSDHELTLDDIGDGQYILRVDCSAGTSAVSFLKSH